MKIPFLFKDIVFANILLSLFDNSKHSFLFFNFVIEIISSFSVSILTESLKYSSRPITLKESLIFFKIFLFSNLLNKKFAYFYIVIFNKLFIIYN